MGSNPGAGGVLRGSGRWGGAGFGVWDGSREAEVGVTALAAIRGNEKEAGWRQPAFACVIVRVYKCWNKEF